MAARYRLVFTHIGKTGGSSVASFLDRIVNACDLNMLTVAGASSLLATADLSERTLEAENLRLGDFQIIKGHVPFATARKYFMPARFVTVLRDPRWQLISNYCSQPSHMDKLDFGMSDFIASVEANPYAEWALDNLHTRMLCDHFNFRRPANSSHASPGQEKLAAQLSVDRRHRRPRYLLPVARPTLRPEARRPASRERDRCIP